MVDFARQEIIDQKIKDKTSEDIASYLVNLKPTETGGITAISGFYYQFLITLKYIIEMLEGEWDFVIMEHHDDIVVGKDKKIRYVQVKTSEKVNVRVTTSPARGLYSRSPKNIDGKKFEKFDSWIDKLLLNSNITRNLLALQLNLNYIRVITCESLPCVEHNSRHTTILYKKNNETSS